MTREDLAWAAGLYEGEGTVFTTTTGARQYRRMQSHITSTDLDVLQKFQTIIGLGKIYGPSKQQKAHHKPQYRWMVTSFEQVQAVIAYLWPWLCTRRRDQAATALTTYHALGR